MRALFGIVGLLMVVAIVGLLARNQLSVGVTVSPPPLGTAVAPAPVDPRQQVQQFKQAIDASLQPPARELPDDAK